MDPEKAALLRAAFDYWTTGVTRPCAGGLQRIELTKHWCVDTYNDLRAESEFVGELKLYYKHGAALELHLLHGETVDKIVKRLVQLGYVREDWTENGARVYHNPQCDSMVVEESFGYSHPEYLAYLNS